MTPSRLPSFGPANRMKFSGSGWACVRPSICITEPAVVIEKDSLRKRLPYLSQEIIDRYQNDVVNQSEESDTSTNLDDEAENDDYLTSDNDSTRPSAVTHRLVVTKAETIINSKYPRIAKRQLPAPRKRLEPTRGSKEDIDRIDVLSDEQPEAGPVLAKPRKRKALEEIILQDPSTPWLDPRPSKRARRMSEEQNDLENNLTPLLDNIYPYGFGPPSAIPQLLKTPVPAKEGSKLCQKQDPPKKTSVQLPSSPGQMPQLVTSPTSPVSPSQPLTPFDEDDLILPAIAPITFEELSKASSPVVPSKRKSEEIEPDAFSDEGELFEALLNQEANIGRAREDEVRDPKRQRTIPFPDIVAPNPPVLARTTAASSAEQPTTAKPSLSTTSTIARTPLKPFIRKAPPISNLSHNSVVGSLFAETRTVTCFRIAELLRLRQQTLSTPVPIDASRDLYISNLSLELIAKVRHAERLSDIYVVEFSDIFFPDRPPYVKAVCKSWTEIEKSDIYQYLATATKDGACAAQYKAVLKARTEKSNDISRSAEWEVLKVEKVDEADVQRLYGIVAAELQLHEEESEKSSSMPQPSAK